MRWSWLLLILGCGPAVTAEPEVDIEALAGMGPHAVGYRVDEVIYTPPLASAPRKLSVHVWYPAAAASEGERPSYFLQRSEVAWTNAAPADLGPRPVLFFSHGHQAYAAAMASWMEHLASHGYIAIAPTHTGDTVSDDGTRKTDIYFLRSFDMRATLDAFLGLNAGHPLAGRMSDQLAIAGHSFGGYTTMALGGARYAVKALDGRCAAEPTSGYCSTLTADKRALFEAGFKDSRFKVMVTLDPGDFDLFGAEGAAAIDRPVLHFVAQASGNPPKESGRDRYWSALHGAEDLRLLLLGGDHNDFTDSCAEGLSFRCSRLAPRTVRRAVRVYALSFLEHHLRHAKGLAPLLNGKRAVSEVIEASVH